MDPYLLLVLVVAVAVVGVLVWALWQTKPNRRDQERERRAQDALRQEALERVYRKQRGPEPIADAIRRTRPRSTLDNTAWIPAATDSSSSDCSSSDGGSCGGD